MQLRDHHRISHCIRATRAKTWCNSSYRAQNTGHRFLLSLSLNKMFYFQLAARLFYFMYQLGFLWSLRCTVTILNSKNSLQPSLSKLVLKQLAIFIHAGFFVCWSNCYIPRLKRGSAANLQILTSMKNPDGWMRSNGLGCISTAHITGNLKTAFAVWFETTSPQFLFYWNVC